MLYPTHLIKINNRFYYKIKVPVDLKHHFPCTFIKKSLKTSDLRAAKTMMVAMEYNIHRSYALLRTGMLPDDIIRKVVEEIVPIKQKVAVVGANLLSAYQSGKDRFEQASIIRLKTA